MNNKISDGSNDRRNFTIIPNYVLTRCDPWQTKLWLTIKSVAGENGECFLATTDLAKLAQMSAGKCSQVRQELLDMGMIEGEVRRDPGYTQEVWHLRIPDVWEKNATWVKNNPNFKDKLSFIDSLHHMKASAKPSPGEQPISPHEGKPSPGETNKIKELNKKEKENNNPAFSAWKAVQEQLKLDMAKATYDEFLKDTVVNSFKDGFLDIGCKDLYTKQWCQSRMVSTVQGLLAGMLNQDVHVCFVVGQKPQEVLA